MSQFPLQMSDVSEAASLPNELYNFSYTTLFPGPHCKELGHATVNGKCVDLMHEKHKVMTSAVQTSPMYGMQQVKDKNENSMHVNRLLGPVACNQGYHSINGHCTQFGPKRTYCSPH